MGRTERAREAIVGRHFTPNAIERLTGAIRRTVLLKAPKIRTPNFQGMGRSDLALLFGQYDERFFDGALRAWLHADGASITFRASARMTRRGGRTQRLRRPMHDGTRTYYEIAIAADLVCQAFNEEHRVVTVVGAVCHDRLDVVQRIFEHELTHLVELLVWEGSSCAQSRFQTLARNIFGHTAFTHELITRTERARAQQGIRVGDRVSFVSKGATYTGLVNRITKRATVLVTDDRGRLYRDGNRYRAFYVPVELLKRVESVARRA